MTAVAVELLTRPPEPADVAEAGTLRLGNPRGLTGDPAPAGSPQTQGEEHRGTAHRVG